jgi:hypothetical protein
MEVEQENRSVVTKTGVTSTIQMDFDVNLLQVYYEKAFPYDLMFKWLSYGRV